MKKLMTSTIILLPVLILAIMLVSGAIMSLFTHIYVEQVEFVENGTVKLVMDDMQAPPTHTLAVNILPLRAKNRGIVFSSADNEVVSVDENGTVTAKFYGKTTVRVTSEENPVLYDEVEVWVTDNSAHAIDIAEYESEMYLGEAQRLAAQILPQEANNKNVIWRSSDDDVLSISDSGNAVCKGAGSVTVTAVSEDAPELTDSVTINCHLPLEGIELSGKVSSFVTALKQAQFPDVEVYPRADNSYKTQYACSDEGLANVDEGGAITFFGAGKAAVTVTVSDDRGHSYSRTATFTCTDGYYTGSLFEQTQYTLDYDELLMGKDSARLPFSLQKSPEGSYRQIVDVDCPPLITLDGEDGFVLHGSDTVPLGTMTLTIHARRYNVNSDKIEDVTDICYVTLTRSTRELSFESDGKALSELTIKQSSIAVREAVGDTTGIVGCIAVPQNHTDRLIFELEEGKDIASLENGVLVFSDEGFVVVRASVTGSVTPATVKITYILPDAEEIEVKIDSETSELRPVVMNFYNNDVKDAAFLNIEAPEGKIVEITMDKPDIVSIDADTRRITPLKGGFVTITVKFINANAAATAALASDEGVTLSIYVDKPVEARSISFDIDDGFKTARKTVQFTVTLNVDADAMEGKELLVNGSAVHWSLAGGVLAYNGEYSFADGEGEKTLTAAVAYSEMAKAYVGDPNKRAEASRRVHTSQGMLDDGSVLTFTCDGKPLKQAEEIVFEDIYEDAGSRTYAQKIITVTVDKPVPADFVFDEAAIASQLVTYAAGFFTASVAYKSESSAEVTLTAVDGGELKSRTLMTVAGQGLALGVRVQLPAHSIDVGYNGQALSNGSEYVTFQEELGLSVSLLRTDGKAVNVLGYTLNGEEHGDNAHTSFKVNVKPSADSAFTITSGRATISFTISKRVLGDFDFEYKLEYTENGRAHSESFSFDDIAGNSRTLSLSTAVQGSLTIGIAGDSLPQGMLGTFVLQQLESFTMTTDVIFTAEFNNDAAGILPGAELVPLFTVKFSDPYFFNAKLVFRYGDRAYTFILDCSGLRSVQFGEGFSMQQSDVYTGYQQARVFAKHSFYGRQTDYLSIPVTAIGDVVSGTNDLAAITWTLTRRQHRPDEPAADTIVTEQRGTKVLYLGEEYKIIPQSGGPSRLVKVDFDKAGEAYTETLIAENGVYVQSSHVTWVDVYAEEGCAHIYFGDFGGLSETDVFNDYFGDFGDVGEGWQPTPDHADNYDNSGRKFRASANAWTFLRVNAGDGTSGTVNCHYNFNVLQDMEATDASGEGYTLVNVFDATGYYNNQHIVLHNRMYGKGELDDNADEKAKAQQRDTILDKDAAVQNGGPKEYAKQLIYGNGHTVNLAAYNEKMGNGNEHSYIKFDKLCNVKLMGDTANDTLNRNTQKIYFFVDYAYYSELSYYWKLAPAAYEEGHALYAKNTVFSAVPKTAVQLQYSQTLYAENITIVECGAGISVEIDNSNEASKHRNAHIYFRGDVDILDYNNKTGLTNMAELVGAVYWDVAPNIADYFEWHGKSAPLINQASFDPDIDKYYVNVLVFSTYNMKGKVSAWDGTSYPEYQERVPMAGNRNILSINLIPYFGDYYFAWTYDYSNSIDGGTINVQNGNQPAISADRESFDELFAEERYIRLLCEYRNFGEKNIDHITWHKNNVYRDKALAGVTEGHIENLKKTLKDSSLTWPDGTAPSQAL